MKLYGNLASPYVARVVLFARLKGLTLVPESPPGGHTRSPEFLKLNPLGKMPLLATDDACLPESDVICAYLEDRFPEKSGLPGSALDRARARLLPRLLDLHVMPVGNALFGQLNPATRDQEKTAQLVGNLRTALGDLEKFLEAKPFAAGAQLSLADCALLPSLMSLQMVVIPALGIEDPTRAGKLGAWWQGMENEPLAATFAAEYKATLAMALSMIAARR